MIKLPAMNAKNINRFVLCLLLIAPIFYLFGSLFTALNGANGVQLFSQEEEETSVDMSVTRDHVVYTRKCYSLDAYCQNASSDDSFMPGYNANFALCCDSSVFDEIYGFAISPTEYYVEIANPTTDSAITDLYMEDYTCFSFAFVTSSELLYFEAFRDNNSNYLHCWNQTGEVFEWEGFLDIESTFGAVRYFSPSLALASAYSGRSITFSSPREIPEVQPNIVTPSVSEEISYSDYVFGQFFAKDNFLVQMGKDSLSDTDSGFLPADSLVRIIDDNILHYGSDNQIACMAYGYFVWVFNVIVLDMVVYLSVRLLILPLKAVDLFDRREDR